MSFHTEFYAHVSKARQIVDTDASLPPCVKLILRDALFSVVAEYVHIRAVGHIPNPGYGEFSTTTVDIQVHPVHMRET